MKYFAFSLILIVVLSGFIACTKADATRTSNNQSSQTNQSNIPKGEYPPAPAALMEAKLTRTDGSTFTLSDYKGKVIVVNAWATWCGPCRYEIPELVRLQTELKDKGLAVVGLNVDADEDAEMIKEFGKELNVNYDLVKADYKLFGEFIKISKKDAIPQTFLIDREGRLLGVFVGAGKSLQRLIESVEKSV